MISLLPTAKMLIARVPGAGGAALPLSACGSTIDDSYRGRLVLRLLRRSATSNTGASSAPLRLGPAVSGRRAVATRVGLVHP